MENGAAVAKRLRGNRGGGIPWITILDKTGDELITSDGPSGNIGCPVTEDERSYFIVMLETSVQRSSAERIQALSKSLEAYAATVK
jgi:hypothetical protein